MIPFDGFFSLKTSFLLFGGLVLISACQQLESIPGLIHRTQWEKYQHTLVTTELAETRMAREWLNAGQKALTDSLTVVPPYQETGFFRADTPTAHGYTFYLMRGQICQIDLTTQPEDLPLFLDFYRQVSNLDSLDLEWMTELGKGENHIEVEIDKTGFYQLRIQAPLLEAGQYDLQIGLAPRLGFPVLGGENRDIGSFWGDPRGNGRKHKGVDVFAKKGTPIVAISPGVVSRVKTGGLGGKTVWVRDNARGYNQYYAHLDSQWVSRGMRVAVGDTLGTVGNTGNPKRTPLHLHFGIYTPRIGAIDPLNYIKKLRNRFTAFKGKEDFLGETLRTGKRKVLLRKSPDKKGETLGLLTPHSPVKILGGTGSFYRVKLPDDRIGYTKMTEIQDLSKPIKRMTTVDDQMLMASPLDRDTPVNFVQAGTRLNVLGQFEEYQLVGDAEAVLGWWKGAE